MWREPALECRQIRENPDRAPLVCRSELAQESRTALHVTSINQFLELTRRPRRSWPVLDMASKNPPERGARDPRDELCTVLTELQTTRLPPFHDWIVALSQSGAGSTTTNPRVVLVI